MSSSNSPEQTPSQTVRSIVTPVAGTLCAIAAVTLAWAPAWIEEYRWIVACLFPLSLVTFLVSYTVRRVPETELTPAERAEERMGAVRVALLTQKLQELQAAHDALAAKLADAPTSVPSAPAEPRPDPAPALRAALAAAEAATVSLKKRAEEFQEAGVLAKIEAERLRADLDAARTQDQSARVAPLLKENGDLRRRATELESQIAAARDDIVRTAADAASSRAETESVRAELAQARDAESRATSRIETLTAEASALRSSLVAAEAANVALNERMTSAAAANERLSDDAARLRADLEAARAADQTARAESLAAENESLRARVSGLEAEFVTARGRIESAEASAAAAEASERELRKRHAAEIANVKARGGRLNLLDNYRPASPGSNAEVERLRVRVEETEEAVRAALRELGVRDAATWPATVEGVTQAVGPLTLCAMGETAPGWNPNPDDDTLAAAVVALAQQSAERQRQLERIGASITQNGRHH